MSDLCFMFDPPHSSLLLLHPRTLSLRLSMRQQYLLRLLLVLLHILLMLELLSLGMGLLLSRLLRHHLVLVLTRQHPTLGLLHCHAVLLDQTVLNGVSRHRTGCRGEEYRTAGRKKRVYGVLTRSSSDIVPTSLFCSPNACAELAMTCGLICPSPSPAYI